MLSDSIFDSLKVTSQPISRGPVQLGSFDNVSFSSSIIY